MSYSIESRAATAEDPEADDKSTGCRLHAELLKPKEAEHEQACCDLHQPAAVTCAAGILAHGSSTGALNLWLTKDIYHDESVAEGMSMDFLWGVDSVPGARARPDSGHCTSVASGWEPCESIRETASCIVMLEQGLPRLIQGFENGSLSISMMPSNKPFELVDAHCSAVTHLFVPTVPSESNALVCSCSLDGTIHIWMVSRVPDAKGSPLHQLTTCTYRGSQISMIMQPVLYPDPLQASVTVTVPFVLFASSDRMLGMLPLPDSKSSGSKNPDPLLMGPHPAPVCAACWHQNARRLYVLCRGHQLITWLLSTSHGSNATLEHSVSVWQSDMVLQLGTSLRTVLCAKPCLVPPQIVGISDESMTASSMRWIELLPVRMGTVSQLDTAGCAMVIGVKRLAAELHKMLKGRKQEQALMVDSTAMSSFPLMAVSYLVIWGHDQNSDKLKRQASPLLPPQPPLLYGMRGHGGVITYLTPCANQLHGHGRWQFSPYMTSVQSLSLVSMARLLLNLGCDNQMCVDLITQACVLLPETIPHFVPPSLSLLARYWEDTWEDLQDAARSLLSAAINRMSPTQRSSCVALWQMRMTTTDLSVPKGVAVVILGIVGCLFPESLDVSLTSQIVAALLTNVHQHTMQSALAADILSRGFVTFQRHIDDLHELIYVLFHYCAEADPKRPSFGERVRNALILISAAVPQPFLEVMAEIGTNVDSLMAHKVLTIQLLKSVITKFTSHFEPHIPVVVDHLMGLLNPGIPARRERCLRACTVVLRTMCHKYQFISFHQESQKYAVGTPGGTIVVYDLRTATKWRILQGQEGPILAVTAHTKLVGLLCLSSFHSAWTLDPYA